MDSVDAIASLVQVIGTLDAFVDNVLAYWRDEQILCDGDCNLVPGRDVFE